MPALSHLKPLILSREIVTFNDLFNHVSVKELATAIKRSPKHIETIRKDSGKMTLGDLWALSEAVWVRWEKVAGLFAEYPEFPLD